MKEEAKKNTPGNEGQSHIMGQSSFDAKPVSNTMAPPAFGLVATEGPSQVGTDEVGLGEEKLAAPTSKVQSPTGDAPDESPSENAKGLEESRPQSQTVPPTGGGGATPPPPPPASVTGLAVARDNFSGRSTSSFGVGEVINLSYRSTATAASLGGLKWSVASGGGTIAGATNAGTGQYTCPGTPATVVLQLKVQSGARLGTVVATKSLTVIAPNDARMVKDSRAIRHQNGTWSAGFYGQIFLRPKTVSFTNIQFQEGAASATASGFLAGWNGLAHSVSSAPSSVGGGNASTGNKVNGIDNVHSGTLGAPYAVGDFNWPIPWQYRVGTGAWATFTTANHHATANAAGRATIAKKGEGPHSKVPSDPTVAN